MGNQLMGKLMAAHAEANQICLRAVIVVAVNVMKVNFAFAVRLKAYLASALLLFPYRDSIVTVASATIAFALSLKESIFTESCSISNAITGTFNSHVFAVMNTVNGVFHGRLIAENANALRFVANAVLFRVGHHPLTTALAITIAVGNGILPTTVAHTPRQPPYVNDSVFVNSELASRLPVRSRLAVDGHHQFFIDSNPFWHSDLVSSGILPRNQNAVHVYVTEVT